MTSTDAVSADPKKVTITHVVAASENNTIGVDGELPWNIPEDLKYFRDKTKGHAIIMGRKTFESVGHPLPHRLNVIITRSKDYQAEGAIVTHSLEEALAVCKRKVSEYGNVIDIIGGGEIYRQSMELVDQIFITRVHRDVIGDTKYPLIDESNFKLVHQEDRFEPESFSFLTYERL